MIIRRISLNVLIIIVLTGAILSGCSGEDNKNDTESTSGILITGDVVESKSSKPWSEMKNQEDHTLSNGEEYKAAPISEALDEVEISGDATDIYFLGKDGFMSRIPYSEIGYVNLTLDDQKGWCIVAPSLPISVNAKELSSIVIVSDNAETGLMIKNKNGKIDRLSLGELLTGPLLDIPLSEGVAETESDGQPHTSEVFTRTRGFSLSDADVGYNGEPVVLVSKSGEKYLTEGIGYFTVENGVIGFIENEGDKYENIIEVQFR